MQLVNALVEYCIVCGAVHNKTQIFSTWNWRAGFAAPGKQEYGLSRSLR